MTPLWPTRLRQASQARGALRTLYTQQPSVTLYAACFYADVADARQAFVIDATKANALANMSEEVRVLQHTWCLLCYKLSLLCRPSMWQRCMPFAAAGQLRSLCIWLECVLAQLPQWCPRLPRCACR